MRTHIYAIVILTIACIATASGTERLLTSTNGQSTIFRLMEKTGDNIVAVRKSDSKRFVIPLTSLIESDQKFIATWTPITHELKPSSVSRSGSPILQRGNYPSRHKPRYSGGGVARVSRGGGGCRYVGSTTTTKPGCK